MILPTGSQPQEDIYQDEAEPSPFFSKPKSSTKASFYHRFVFFSLFFCSLCCNVWLLFRAPVAVYRSRLQSQFTIGLEQRPLVNRTEGFWAPEYDPDFSDEAKIEQLWQNADPGFGIIALDHRTALQNGLSPSRTWPLDHSKYVYTFTVYHAMHCLYQRLAAGEPRTGYKIAHDWHCFEMIREELMCTATEALFAGRLDADNQSIRIGLGESRQCTDWEYLRDWASQHTAGYVEVRDRNGDMRARYVEGAARTDGWYIPPA